MRTSILLVFIYLSVAPTIRADTAATPAATKAPAAPGKPVAKVTPKAATKAATTKSTATKATATKPPTTKVTATVTPAPTAAKKAAAKPAVKKVAAPTPPTKLAKKANTANLHRGFGACVDGKRDMFYYSEPADKGKRSFTCGTGEQLDLPPVRGLECNVECGVGYYLGVNESGQVPVSACAKCPASTYSVGGGALYTGKAKVWRQPWPAEFRTDCISTPNGYDWDHINCSPWVPERNGSIVTSGDQGSYHGRYRKMLSILYLNANFVRDGYVVYRYKVDSEEGFDGLQFVVDASVRVQLVSQVQEWKEEKVKITKGSHTLKWEFHKDYDGSQGADKAQVQVVQVVGTKMADTHCTSCSLGDNSNGEDDAKCRLCKANHYATLVGDSGLQYECVSCPASHYSNKGSVGVEECIKRLPCSFERDMRVNYTACDAAKGVRTKVTQWVVPKICNVSHPRAVDLSKYPAVTEPCPGCAPGNHRKKGLENKGVGACEPCPQGWVGQHFDTKVKDKKTGAEVHGTSLRCAECSSGMVAMRELRLGQVVECSRL